MFLKGNELPRSGSNLQTFRPSALRRRPAQMFVFVWLLESGFSHMYLNTPPISDHSV